MSSCCKALPLNAWPRLVNVIYGVQKWKSIVWILWWCCCDSKCDVRGWVRWRAVNTDAFGGEKFTFACPPASQFVFVSLRETLRSAQQHSDCADGCCTIAPVFSAMQIDSQQGLYLLLKALNFHIFSVHDVIGLHFLYLGCHTNALYPTK